MNNYLCPFCQTPLSKTIEQDYKRGNETISEFSYSCNFKPCQDSSPQKVSRWFFQAWEGRNINYYRAHLPWGDKHYFIQGSSNAWTRLFYDAPSMGALVRAPIMELPYIAPQEPLLESLESCLKKMMNFIIFT